MFGIAGIVIGIIMIMAGGYFVFFMPGPSARGLPTYQPHEFGVSFIVIGIFLIIIGAVLVFL
jgi:hypothetical protein